VHGQDSDTAITRNLGDAGVKTESHVDAPGGGRAHSMA
jgi:hypothetical protein